MSGHTPDLQLTATIQLQRRVTGVGGLQAQTAAVTLQSFEREGAIKNNNNHTTRTGLEAAIHQQQITVMNTCSQHRITTDPQQKGADRTGDQLGIEINTCLDVVIGRAGKAGLNDRHAISTFVLILEVMRRLVRR